MGKHLLSKKTGISTAAKTASGKASAVRAIDPQDDTVTLTVGKGDDAEDVTEVIKTVVRDFAKASDKEKSYKAEKDQAASYLRKYVGDMRDENALEGDYQKTYRIMGPTGKGGVQYAADVSQADKFAMPKDSDLIEALKDELDKDVFDENFEKVLTIQIKPEILKNDKKRREFSKVIIEAIGVEGLQKYFQKEEVYQVKPGLDKRQYEMEDEDREIILSKVKPTADSVKNTTYTE